FQAEDSIRDRNVTGVQTCALPISSRYVPPTGSHIAAATAAVQPPIPNPTLRASAGAISSYAIRSEGTRNLRPLSSAIRNSPSSEIGRASCRERGKDVEVESGG